MIVLVDIDGVVAETHKRWLELYNRDWRDNLTIDDITDWSVHKFVKPECGAAVYGYLRFPWLYDDVEEVEGAFAGVSAIRSMGHRVVFVSAGMYPGKVEWLHRHGFLVEYPHGTEHWEAATDVVLAGDKSIIRGSVLIDDRWENVRDFHSFSILYDRPWNSRVSMVTKLWKAYNWDHVVEVIRSLS